MVQGRDTKNPLPVKDKTDAMGTG